MMNRKALRILSMSAAIALALSASACFGGGGGGDTTTATIATIAAATTAESTAARTTEATTARTTAEEMTFEETTGEAATAEEATGEETTAEEATGEAATAEEAAGEETASGEAASGEAAAYAGPSELSDDIYSFTLSLNGVVYELPAPYSMFRENGWIAEGLDGMTLEPNQKTFQTKLKNGRNEIYAAFVNTESAVKPFEQCDVGLVSLDSYFAEKGAALVFPKGITLDSTFDEIIAAYGLATESYESEYAKTLTYSNGSYASIKISFDLETDIADELEMENLVKKSFGSPEYAGGPPEDVPSYRAPDGLGDKWDSFIVLYADNYYSVPAPISAFLENGWVLETDPNFMVSGKSPLVGVELRLGNQTLRTSIRNYSGTEQPIKYCYVTTIESSMYKANVPIQLPKGITEDSTLEELFAAYGEPDKSDESDTFCYYTYGMGLEKIEFVYDNEIGRIITITVDNDLRNLP